MDRLYSKIVSDCDECPAFMADYFRKRWCFLLDKAVTDDTFNNECPLPGIIETDEEGF